MAYQLTEVEQAALVKLIAYWLDHWQWAATPLFGRSRDDYQQVLSAWPQSFETQPKLTGSVIKSALNEFLNGSAPVADMDFVKVVGLARPDVKKLYENLVQ